MKKKIMMIMPVMKGGGAERVAALLINEFNKKGHDVRFLLTSCKEDEVIRTDLSDDIPLVTIPDVIDISPGAGAKTMRLISSCICRVFEQMGKQAPAKMAYISFVSQYGKEIEYIRNILKKEPDLNIISFLQPSIPMAVLAGKGLPNKIIISERGNPERLMFKRYGKKFIEKYFSDIHRAVFQTEYARNIYPDNVSGKGAVISNPIKPELPEPYEGKRNNYITTFCRISKQKNLPMLLKGFAKLADEFPQYKLKIIGDAFNEEGNLVLAELHEIIKKLQIENKVEFKPFSAEVHKDILEDAIYVNSSNYEGISNAMLESMAIGLPVVCTDCPVGGARATIENKENGMLIPVDDEEALYKALKSIVEDEKLAQKLSTNGSKLRESLSVEQIANRWLELI